METYGKSSSLFYPVMRSFKSWFQEPVSRAAASTVFACFYFVFVPHENVLQGEELSAWRSLSVPSVFWLKTAFLALGTSWKIYWRKQNGWEHLHGSRIHGGPRLTKHYCKWLETFGPLRFQPHGLWDQVCSAAWCLVHKGVGSQLGMSVWQHTLGG